jgi:hypothetical protein
MVRTEIVRLKSMEVIAYKVKLPAGGAGITLVNQSGDATFTINKRNGEFLPYRLENVFSLSDECIAAALKEAVTATRSMPFGLRGPVAYTADKSDKAMEEMDCAGNAEAEKDATDDEKFVVLSGAYTAILEKYTDKKGKFSYALMNKDMIQFASRSKMVTDMIAAKIDTEQIVVHIVNNRVTELKRGHKLTEGFICELVEILDDMDTRSAFKELRKWIRLQKK